MKTVCEHFKTFSSSVVAELLHLSISISCQICFVKEGYELKLACINIGFNNKQKTFDTGQIPLEEKALFFMSMFIPL